MKNIEVISSKSDAHRALICAALAEIQGGAPCSVIYNETSKDIEATLACTGALKEGREEMLCGESGSTLRFMLPVAGALGIRAAFYPEGRLPDRPLSPLREELEAHGVTLSPQGSVPFISEGQLTSGDFTIPGNVSSQYISGLMFALPLIEGDSRILIEGPLQSSGYVDLTLEVIRRFGIVIDEEQPDGSTPGITGIYSIKGGQRYTAPEIYKVEGDWSNAAFWLAAGVIGPEPLTVKGLEMQTSQGDKEIVEILERFGADITVCGPDDVTGCSGTEIVCRPSLGKLRGITIDAGAIPDMVPSLALIASCASGTTEIVNAGRLRIKESDRLKAVTQQLNAIGADIEELPEGLRIHGLGADETDPEGTIHEGSKILKGGQADSVNDHRIVMTAAVASLVSEGKVAIKGWQAVRKSYPSFFEKMEELGLAGNIELVQ